MSEDSNNTTPGPGVINELHETARDLGIQFHPNISEANLRARIQEHLDNQMAEADEEEADAPEAKKIDPEQIRKDATKLVRVRVSCMNPAKSSYQADYFCAGNRYTGMIKKVVKFNEDWHVPQIILNEIRSKKYQSFVKRKVRLDSGVTVEKTEGRLVPEYAVEILPDLTEAELKELSQRQAMASGSAEALAA